MRVGVGSTFVACSLMCCSSALAQDPANIQHTAGQIVRASDIRGLVVYNEKNERLGKIEDLVLDPSAGTIRYAVLSFGGLLGMGDKYFALPWKSVSFVAKGQSSSGTEKESYCVLNVDKDFLKKRAGLRQEPLARRCGCQLAATYRPILSFPRGTARPGNDEIAWASGPARVRDYRIECRERHAFVALFQCIRRATCRAQQSSVTNGHEYVDAAIWRPERFALWQAAAGFVLAGKSRRTDALKKSIARSHGAPRRPQRPSSRPSRNPRKRKRAS